MGAHPIIHVQHVESNVHQLRISDATWLVALWRFLLLRPQDGVRRPPLYRCVDRRLQAPERLEPLPAPSASSLSTNDCLMTKVPPEGTSRSLRPPLYP